MGRWSWGRAAAGLAAILVLAILSLLLPRWGELRLRAVVEAGRTFTLSSLEEGNYSWTLREGETARGQGITHQRVLRLGGTDLVEIKLNPALSNGKPIIAGDRLATFHSPRLERRVAEFESMHASLESTQALLAAGGRVEEVREARLELDLARAKREGELPQLERIRALAAEGLVTAAQLDEAELEDRVQLLEIDLAEANLAVTRASERPEALQAMDARMATLEHRLAELHSLLDQNNINSPIDGILEVGGRRNLLRVYDIETVYLRIPIPEADRHRVHLGDDVDFDTPACPRVIFTGNIVDLGENAVNLNGGQIFWASVELDNPDHLLRSGMTGVALVPLHGSGEGLLDSLWHQLTGV
jgi:hypothetical protein